MPEMSSPRERNSWVGAADRSDISNNSGPSRRFTNTIEKPMRAKRKDRNHNEIAEAFERFGFSTHDVSALPDFCDLVIYRPLNGTILVEIKDGTKPPSRRSLRASQIALAQQFPVVVIYSVEDVIALANGSLFDCDIPRHDIDRD